MTSDDHDSMRRYLRDEESFKDVLIQHVTVANVVALILWGSLTIIAAEIRLLWWLQILIACVGLALVSWLARRVWQMVVAEWLRAPFSMGAYMSRLPFTVMGGGIFSFVLWFIIRPAISLGTAVTGGVLVTLALNIILWWSEFNRLRKICLTHL